MKTWNVMVIYTLATTILIGAVTVWLWNDTSEVAPKTSGAMQALQQWNTQRAYPGKEIPEGAYYRAYQYAKQNIPNAFDKQTTNIWQPIGPHNIGGRTLAIAFNPQNPNTIYAGSASGGLWRSYSGGVGVDAWDYVPTGHPVLGVSSIAIAPGDSNTIYIGTGETYNYGNSIGGLAVRTTRGSYGIGILKTTDGGQTWTKSLDWSYHQNRGVWSVVINPLNPNTIWAATTEGVYKSGDAGATWNRVHSVIMAMHLVMSPADTNTVYLGCGNLGSAGHGIYRTTDGGTNWQKLTNGLPATFGGKVFLSIHQANPQIIYASIGNGSTSGSGTWLVKTTDGGDHWTIVNTLDYATYQGWFAHVVGVHPIDPNLVITAGVDIFKSYNGGATLNQKTDWWRWYFGNVPPGGPEGPPNYSHADHHFIVYHPTNPDIIYFGTDGGIFRSLDGGETFEGRNGGYQTTQFYNGFSSSPLDSLLSIGGMQDNATAIYEGNIGWRRVIGGDGSWTAIDPFDINVMYGSSQYLSIRKSVNHGNDWSSQNPPGNSLLTSFIAPFVLAPSNRQVLYAGRSVIYRSVNGGASWNATNGNQPLDGNPALGMAISATNSSVVYVTTAPVLGRAGVFVTQNGGFSWTNITGNLPDRYPVDIAVDPSNDAIAYLVFSGYGSSHVFKTQDFGTTWQDIGGLLPDVPTTAVVIDPDYPDHVYLGTDLGVYVSLDGGLTWQSFQNGMEDAAIVMDLSIVPGTRKIRAATHGRGAFERRLIDQPTGITASDGQTPGGFYLAQNYPNPFNPSTSVRFRIVDFGMVRLTVFDMTGRKVKTLINQSLSPGMHEVQWNGTDESGRQVASGSYVYQLRVGKQAQSRTMLLVK